MSRTRNAQLEKATNGTKPKPRLVIDPPDENSPGYLYRLRVLTSAEATLTDTESSAKAQLAAFDDMAEVLLPHVIEPKDPDEARALLLGPDGLSQKEFTSLMGVQNSAPLSANGSETP